MEHRNYYSMMHGASIYERRQKMEIRTPVSALAADTKEIKMKGLLTGAKMKTKGGEGGEETALKKNYDTISKNGDTVELSENGRKLQENPDTDGRPCAEKKVIKDADVTK